MELTDAIKLVRRLIEKEETHCDYKHTVDLAKKYAALITGCNIGEQLERFVKREDEAAFAQRCAITKSITPAVAASVRRPFNKVSRNDRVKRKIKVSTDARLKVVNNMMASYYGAKRKKNKGLDLWMKTRFLELQFSDPNAWIVMEWTTPADATQVAQPRPFEVSAEMARNFFVINDDIKWLFVCQDITYLEGAGEEATEKHGHRWTLYEEEVTVVFENVDKGYLQSTGYQLQSNESFEQINEELFLVRSFDPKLGFAPVVRIGYNRDEETKSRTYVNPWHAGLCFFEKMLVTVSELDLTMALHVFPQKFQYVHKCPGESREKRCKDGYITDGNKCGVCNGSGYKVHTTAQEVVLLPMPESKIDQLDLDGLMVYKSPPIELIKFQNDYTLQLERQVHQAVFNSQVFVKNHYSTDQASGDPQKTAFEVDANMQSVYDTLEPYTEKYSEVWKDKVTMFSMIAGETDIDKIEITYNFPVDFKLKTSDLLMAERKVAKDSGAPPFYLETIDDDIAAITFMGDDVGMQAYKVKRRYFPFAGKNEDEVALLMASEFVPKAPKVLYANFEQIFKELVAERVDFFLMNNLKEQAELVKKKVDEYILKLETEQPVFNTENFKPNVPGSGEGGPGDDNPGTGEEEEAEEENENNPA